MQDVISETMRRNRVERHRSATDRLKAATAAVNARQVMIVSDDLARLCEAGGALEHYPAGMRGVIQALAGVVFAEGLIRDSIEVGFLAADPTA